MKYQVENTRRNRMITLAVLESFQGVEAEFITKNCMTYICLSTDSAPTWSAIVAAFDDDFETAEARDC